MKLNKRQLRMLIESVIHESSDDWPGEKPWWANSAVAKGLYDKEAELVDNITKKFKEYNESFSDIDKGKLSDWSDKGLSGKFQGDNWAKSASKTSASQGDPLSRLYVMFECVAIARKFDIKGYKDMYKQWQEKTKFVATAASDQPSFETEKDAKQIQAFLVSAFNGSGEVEKLDNILKDKPAKGGVVKGGDDADPSEFEAVSVGDDSDFKVYTIKGESGYAYSGNPGEWVAYKQPDLKKGVVSPSKKFKNQKLDRLFKNNKLETNPAYAKKISDSQKQKNLSEGLSRGSLYRMRYRRY